MIANPASTVMTRRMNLSDILLDGLFAGAIGAISVALWFLLLDALAGRPFFTPALLGTVLLHGGAAAGQGVTVTPLPVAAYTAFHFLAFLVAGTGFSWLMTLFERFPIVGFVLLVVFVCLQLGFFALNVALGAELVGQLRAWTVIVANLLAAGSMSLYLWKRHPQIRESLAHAWDQEA
jgi:hypothetical protein